MRYQCHLRLFAAALWLTFCHSPAALRAQTANPAADTATISGRVTLNGKPARGIKVALVPGPYAGVKHESVRTDDAGRYEFTGLAAGRYGLVAASYVHTSVEYWQSSVKPFKLCTVLNGEKLTNQNLTLVRGGVITGRITDADGRPLIAEAVRFTYVDEQGKQQPFLDYSNEMLRTDDRGIYRLFGLAPGRYLISAGKTGPAMGSPGPFYRRVYYPGVRNSAQATPIEVKPGSEATNIDLRLGTGEKTFSVSGRVVDDATGQLVTKAGLDFWLAETPQSELRQQSAGTPINERGTFYYENLPPGRYGLSGTALPEYNHYGDLVTFEITDQDVEDLTIRMKRGAIINGTLVLENNPDPAALQNIRVFVGATSTDPGFARRLPGGYAQLDGRFQLRALPAGKVGLRVGGEGRQFSILRIERNGAEVQETFDLKPAEQVNGVRVVLKEAAGGLRGRIVLPGGPLPAGYMLSATLQPLGNNVLISIPLEINPDLSFDEPSLVVGEYEISVTVKVPTGVDGSLVPVRDPIRLRVTVQERAATEVVVTVDLR
ncbi:MAG: carboxypeptidase regulatory-like domain-containing protein [Acidobacteria bacterium]|nr:carboxypeptidase regulatory-like domain-containing protein [Acidobacteriota bacterium]MBI3427630.1 carboxypeptidase regulatory-like domain-containing protein [Acidobacteriota bacterium]